MLSVVLEVVAEPLASKNDTKISAGNYGTSRLHCKTKQYALQSAGRAARDIDTHDGVSTPAYSVGYQRRRDDPKCRTLQPFAPKGALVSELRYYGNLHGQDGRKDTSRIGPQP